MSDKTIFFTKTDGKVKAILNWRTRAKEDALILSDTLDTEEMALFYELKSSGEDEESIFDRIFPPHNPGQGPLQVTIAVDQLTKAQLAYLIEKEMQSTLPSLKKMSKEDLLKLFLDLTDDQKQ